MYLCNVFVATTCLYIPLMRTNCLLPHSWQKFGWWLLLLVGTVDVITLVDDDLIWACCPDWVSANDLMIVLSTAALLMVAFSREAVEDEYVMHIRVRSLVRAVVANYAILLVATFFLYDLKFFTFMAVNMFTVPILYILFFRIGMFRIRQSAVYEE